MTKGDKAIEPEVIKPEDTEIIPISHLQKKLAKPKKKLTVKQVEFCNLYTTNKDFFGNGVRSYAEAFNYEIKDEKSYQHARTEASKLLTHPHVLAYMDVMLSEIALNATHVDKQLAFLITQNADFGTKLGGIREFNRLRGRIEKKINVTASNRAIGKNFGEHETS